MLNKFNFIIIKMLSFKAYSFISIISTIGVIFNAIQKHETFFNTVVYLTSSKINLLVFFNFLVVALFNIGNILVWIFFSQIRSIESKVSNASINSYSILSTNPRRRFFISCYWLWYWEAHSMCTSSYRYQYSSFSGCYIGLSTKEVITWLAEAVEAS